MISILKIFSFISLFIAISFVFNGHIRAQEATPQGNLVQVDHIAGFLEKIGEKISLLFQFNKDSKADIMQKLLDKRASELEYVLKNGQGDLVEETSSRYSSYVGSVANFITSNNLTAKKETLLNQLNNHYQLIKKQQEKFTYDSGFWLLLQHDLNTINMFKESIPKN